MQNGVRDTMQELMSEKGFEGRIGVSLMNNSGRAEGLWSERCEGVGQRSVLKAAGACSSEGHCGRGGARATSRNQIMKGLWVMRRLCHEVKVLVWNDGISFASDPSGPSLW